MERVAGIGGFRFRGGKITWSRGKMLRGGKVKNGQDIHEKAGGKEKSQ